MTRFRGPWERYKDKLRRAESWLVGGSTQDLNHIGKMLTDEVRKRIREERVEGPPLRPGTVDWKTFIGAPFPNRPWHESGWLQANGLNPPAYERRGSGKLAIVLVASARRHPHTNLTANRLFAFTEFGTSKQAARPVFRPILRDIASGKGPIDDALRDVYEARVRANLG